MPAEAFAQPTFLTSGYLPLLVDDESPDVSDNIDIIELAYQSDETYAYFKITVQDGEGYEASFASDRFYLYIDIDGDDLPDRLLRNTSASNATLDNWNGTQWVAYASGWCEDPDDTPDNHVLLACRLSDINGGDFTVVPTAGQDNPKFDETIRDPNDDPNMGEVAGSSSSNPTAVVVSDFDVQHAGGRLRFRWRAAIDPEIAGFDLYAVWNGPSPAEGRRRSIAMATERLRPAGGKKARLKLNKKLIVAPSPLPEADYVFVCRPKGRRADQFALEVVRLDGDHEVVGATSLPSPK